MSSAHVNPNAYAYLKEKFFQAVYDLATGEGTVKARVEAAYHRFWLIPLEDFPEALRADRRLIEQRLMRLGGPVGHVLPENFRRMRNRTAAEIAALILGIHFQLARSEEA